MAGEPIHLQPFIKGVPLSSILSKPTEDIRVFDFFAQGAASSNKQIFCPPGYKIRIYSISIVMDFTTLPVLPSYQGAVEVFRNSDSHVYYRQLCDSGAFLTLSNDSLGGSYLETDVANQENDIYLYASKVAAYGTVNLTIVYQFVR